MDTENRGQGPDKNKPFCFFGFVFFFLNNIKIFLFCLLESCLISSRFALLAPSPVWILKSEVKGQSSTRRLGPKGAPSVVVSTDHKLSQSAEMDCRTIEGTAKNAPLTSKTTTLPKSLTRIPMLPPTMPTRCG